MRVASLFKRVGFEADEDVLRREAMGRIATTLVNATTDELVQAECSHLGGLDVFRRAGWEVGDEQCSVCGAACPRRCDSAGAFIACVGAVRPGRSLSGAAAHPRVCEGHSTWAANAAPAHESRPCVRMFKRRGGSACTGRALNSFTCDFGASSMKGPNMRTRGAVLSRLAETLRPDRAEEAAQMKTRTRRCNGF